IQRNVKYLPKGKTPESLYSKALRAFKNIQNDNGKFVICLSKKKDKYKVVIWKREKFLYFSLPKS
ncbi:hypothetical protein, partial [Streptococcus ruminantium]|uniref:hypothetical protein n=1 Tax=Streptococcus ruminantium TaxID=1917441 RepID=UPI00280F7FE1